MAAQLPPPPPPPTLDVLPLPTPPREPPATAVSTAPDAVDQLLQKVDAAYNAGMADYRAGNLEKAKDEFDQSLSLLLESGLDIQGDDRLSAEFDKLVQNEYSAEVAALERGDTLSPHNYVPSPMESFTGLTFPVDPRVKERAQRELKSVRSDLPLVSNDYVDGILTYIQNHARGYMGNILKRIGLYQPMISEALRKEGVPQDLIYLAAGESAFNPLAISKAHCVGIWQFALGTGELYGLKKDRWVDDRFDPAKSTLAAAHHLKDLYRQFGDWFLVMAAYDSGPLTVQRAIEKTGYADYWKLRELHALPTETENYVPIFIATALIAKDPKTYGFDVPPDPPLKNDQVVVNVPTDLRLVAQLIDRPVEDIARLNPSLLRWTTPANDPNFVLNLPTGTKDLYDQKIASIPPDRRIWWQAHKVEEGETLASIARKFRISPVALAEVNQISRDTMLEAGDNLVLPLTPGRESSLVRVRERGPRRLIYYRVRAGDTLDLIADRYDTTPYQIRRWNKMRGSRLTAGKSLRLYVAGRGSSSRSARSRRRGKSGTGTLGPKKSHATKSASAPRTSPTRHKETSKDRAAAR
ncbi:MAG: transglycosylase SLT domain-containing protein [Acidobacteriia bacterium]|nr:transglycosylase SLT domain-containing protein [Terriglobia bacterium]